MLFLLIKLFTTPALIWASTLAARRWGPVIGGGLAGLPFISGPASLFIAVQYGTPFAASAAASSLLGAVASCCYCLAYAHSARHFGWAGSLALALLAFLLCAFLFTRVSCGLPVAVCLSIAVPAACLRLLPDIVCLEPLGIASGYCIAALGALLTSILIMHCVNKRR